MDTHHRYYEMIDVILLSLMIAERLRMEDEDGLIDMPHEAERNER